MRKLYRSVAVTILTTVILGGIYPAVIYLAGHFFFSFKSKGSLVVDPQGGKFVGSYLIGQSFTDPRYLHPRPSSAGKAGYDGMASSGSNLAPTSQKQFDAVTERAKAYRAENMLGENDTVPGDAVMASGSGLDPAITLNNALLQAERIALKRNLSVQEVRTIIRENADIPYFGVFGSPQVNVLKVNLALDCIEPSNPSH